MEKAQISNWWFALACWLIVLGCFVYTMYTETETLGVMFIASMFGTLATLGIRFPSDRPH